ncbi:MULTISPECIES: M18 family aminopeptidase [unclassified Fibrobacter]|uniref:M18 family aminopeptidase n=1 Tax=unclassified Fibrobacter TaxID=2634177 RepID=UPI000922710E|nr:MULTISPECIES: M18 family aminopeptidase [unclassified Fibrobacter]OWV05934.1 M18 family aminopeptidase [Fibrobacter sp. UWH3]SHL10863.1 aspartyl aminopeptidase [Fibrobacter sp. UWH6]
MDFFEFLDSAVTPFHTVSELKKAFEKAGFGKDSVFERNGALIAVRLPRKVNSNTRFRIALAHTDFPALRISPNPDKNCAGVNKLHVETYGGLLYTSWLDRDLGYAGLLAFEKDGQVGSRLIRGSKLFRIPQLAIHLNRGVNQDGLKVNPQTDLDALWSSSSSAADASRKFADVLQAELGGDEHLLDFDVQFFDAQPASVGGFNDEWVYSGRLDNLSSCHAIAEAMLNSDVPENDFLVAAFMNNEEVGSVSRDGAGGNFLQSTLETLWNRYAQNGGVGRSLSEVLADSLALSIDMAHAEHPNFPQKHESNHAPVLGGGVVLKTNAQKRYASDVLSSAQFKLLCKKADVPYQTFITRNDMPCGSTVGPTISASLGIPTVDIGEPMLSMHSIREMIASKDHVGLISLLKIFLGKF